MKTIPHFLAASVLFVSSNYVVESRGDTIQLANGDTLNGKVHSLDDKQMKFESEILGIVSIARENIVSITLGDVVLPNKQTMTGVKRKDAPIADKVSRQLDAHGIDSEKVGGLLNQLGVSSAASSAKGGADSSTPEDVIKQLQTQGIDKSTMDQLQRKIPLLGFPGVSDYFNEQISGLIGGSINLQDLRKDAVKARDGLMDLKKDLGPSGRALDGYLSILNKFIRETETSKPSNDKRSR